MKTDYVLDLPVSVGFCLHLFLTAPCSPPVSVCLASSPPGGVSHAVPDGVDSGVKLHKFRLQLCLIWCDLGQGHDLSKSPFPYLSRGDNNSIYLIGSL